MSEIVRYTNAIPPLSTVADANTRRVLEAIVNGWRTRNGELKPDSDERFITKGELSSLVSDINNGYFTSGPGRTILDSAASEQNPFRVDITGVLQALTKSPLWNDLGQRVERINLSLVTEQLARIAAVQQVADDLVAEAETRLGFDDVQGSAIEAIEEVNEAQALQISGLTTRVGGAENTIINLQETTTTQATSLTNLTSRVAESESNITELFTTTASQATSLTSLTTRVGDTESNVSTLNETTANQASSLTALSVSLNSTNAAITDEATARANADNAITESVATQFSTINTSLSAIQTNQTTLSNSVASLASTTTTLQTAVGDNATAISTEATARANADSSLSAKYSVKIDVNGYVSGFGLMSTANNATPTSDFIVRADRFGIGSPSGPGIAPKTPFVVLTTTDEKDNPPGVYIDTAVIKNAAIESAKIADAAIQSAKIADAAITTLKVDGEAIFVSRYDEGWASRVFSATAYAVATLELPIAGLPPGETAPVILQGYANHSPTDGSGASVFTDISVNGVVRTASFGVSVFGNASFAGNSTQVDLGNGLHSIDLLVRVSPPGAASKFLNTNAVLVAMSGKR